MMMTEYQRTLVEENLSIVDWVIRKKINVIQLPLLTYEDFYQIGCEALCRAAMKFDPAKGSFKSLGNRYVYNAIIDHCRKENQAIKHAEDNIVDEENEPVFLLYQKVDPDYDGIINEHMIRERLEHCKASMNGIAQRGVEAIELKSLGFSTKEIAEKFGTSVNNVNAWISRARSRLENDPYLSSLGKENCC